MAGRHPRLADSDNPGSGLSSARRARPLRAGRNHGKEARRSPILLLASIGVGAVMGTVFFGLFVKTVPPAVLTSFNKGTAHAAFIFYGLGAGFFIFVWSTVAIAASGFFKGRRR